MKIQTPYIIINIVVFKQKHIIIRYSNLFDVGLFGQNILGLKNLKKGLIEIIKYGSKIFTEPDLKKRDKEISTTQIFVKALDVILNAMKGKRIFDRFGFNLPKKNNKEKNTAKLLLDYSPWEYDIKSSDWLNVSTGDFLSGYSPPSHLQALL